MENNLSDTHWIHHLFLKSNNKGFDFVSKACTSLFEHEGEDKKKPPHSGVEKYHNFQVTSCLQNVTTSVDFAYIKSE